MNPSSNSSKRLPSRIDEFDGLRGILALWVAVAHIFCWCGFSQLKAALPQLQFSGFRQLWVEFSFASGAVDTFIILSGFAISFMLCARPQGYCRFMTGRFFRIYPVYLACLVAGFSTIYVMPFILRAVVWHDNEYLNLYVRPILDATSRWPTIHLISHLTLLFGIIPEKILPHGAYTLLSPAWSVSLEWQYYLIAPFLTRFFRPRLGLLIFGLVSCGDILYEHFWSGAFLLEKLPLFLIGIGSFHLYARAGELKNLRYRPHIFAALISTILIVKWHWLALLIWTIVFGSVLANSDYKPERFLLGPRRFLLLAPLQFLGKISYPLYLVHWPAIIWLMAALVLWQPEISARCALIVIMIAGLPAIIIAAWLLHKWVEKPLMQYAKKFT